MGDCLNLGLATHAVPEIELECIRKAIIEQGNPQLALEEHAITKDYETSHEIRSVINACFGTHTLEECMELLYKKSNEGLFLLENVMIFCNHVLRQV